MNWIKEVLKEKNLRQTWLEEKLGKSYNMINSYVQNRRQPSIEVQYNIAEILVKQPSELLQDKNQMISLIKQAYSFHNN